MIRGPGAVVLGLACLFVTPGQASDCRQSLKDMNADYRDARQQITDIRTRLRALRAEVFQARAAAEAEVGAFVDASEEFARVLVEGLGQDPGGQEVARLKMAAKASSAVAHYQTQIDFRTRQLPIHEQISVVGRDTLQKVNNVLAQGCAAPRLNQIAAWAAKNEGDGQRSHHFISAEIRGIEARMQPAVMVVRILSIVGQK